MTAPNIIERRPKAWGRRVRRARHLVQAVVVAYIVWMVYAHVAGGETEASAEAFCPFGGIETAWTWITTGRTTAHVHLSNIVLGVGVVAMAVVGRGFFCGWLCPLGSIQEWIHRSARALVRRSAVLRRVTHRIGARLSWLHRVDRVLRYGRYVVLVWAVGGTAIGGVLVFRDADPWNALLTVTEIQLGIGAIVLATTMVLSLFVERPWCRYACPLGAVVGLVGKSSPVAVQRESASCNACGSCTTACPMDLEVHTATRVTGTQCIGCLECVAACPHADALDVTFSLPLRRHDAATTTEPADEPALVDA